jgi:gamma-glutamyltranspeptidase / glutathione hydrolase
MNPPPYVTWALINLLDRGMSVTEAIDAPRFRLNSVRSAPRPAWDIGKLAAETRITAATMDGLATLGLVTAPLGDYGPTGAMHAVMEDADTGQLIGASDPRGTGQAAGY